MKYYNNEKEITMEEAHALRDKSGLLVADNPQTFKKEKVVKKEAKKNGKRK